MEETKSDTQYTEYSIFTFDSVTDYQKFGDIDEKVRKVTLLGNNEIMFENFDHTETNEKYRKMGAYIATKDKHKLSKEMYSKWVTYIKDCALHGEFKPNGDRRNLQEY